MIEFNTTCNLICLNLHKKNQFILFLIKFSLKHYLRGKRSLIFENRGTIKSNLSRKCEEGNNVRL